jgi:hypothetical protein
MKLALVSSQSKGLMGGVSFEVKGRVDLTPEEQQLVRHYKLEGSVVLKKKAKNIWGQLTDVEVSVFVKNLLSGDSFKCKSLDEVISYRESLISACRNLRAYLDVARTFDNEVIIDIDALVAAGEKDNEE